MKELPFLGKNIQLLDREEAEPGDFWFVGDKDGNNRGLGFMCPCGCGEKGVVLFYVLDGSPKWAWNGSIDKPSLSPSIQWNTPCRWHGHLTNGVWTK